MKEGRNNDHYLILFEPGEVDQITEAYGLERYIPKHNILGLLDWDDFILENQARERFTVPAVPLDPGYLKRLEVPLSPEKLTADTRFTGKIKWYIKPLIFGGDAKAQENMTWITHPDHQAAVKWWNEKYQELKRAK
jgi:hypothetical protein